MNEILSESDIDTVWHDPEHPDVPPVVIWKSTTNMDSAGPPEPAPTRVQRDRLVYVLAAGELLLAAGIAVLALHS